MTLYKVVSGGQTGPDQAGLLIASKHGLEIGGWCPKGGLDEEGMDVRKLYPELVEATTADPDERTALNIRDSDGTLIIVPRWPLPKEIRDGTLVTIQEVEKTNKPCLIFDLSNKNHDAHMIQEWVESHRIGVLNVAGPRESNSRGIYKKTCDLLVDFFTGLQPRPRM